MHISTVMRRSRIGMKTVTLTGVLAVATLGLAGPSAAQSDELEPDEISHSANVSHVANIPRQGVNEDFTHSDLAFWEDYAIQGTYGGINIYDIKNPRKTELVSQFSCPGGQGDPTVTPDGSLVFMSVDYARSDDSCNSSDSSPADPNAWEGMRIIDTSDMNNPEYVGSVQTDCGSHTHTLVPGDNDDVVYLYVSSYGPAPVFPNCQPPHDSISIIEVPLDNPAEASVIAKPNLFPDGGAPGTAGCHDITVFPEEDLAAGACMGEGVLMDISDPADPYVITSVRDSNFAFWHSATFTNDADRVIFTDELGGGGAATCNEEIGPQRGANAIFDITGEGDNREFEFRSYFKIPRHQQETENCVAHNGSLIPVKDGDIMVQSWYQGGVSVFDFTDPDNPEEIGYFERGPLPDGAGGGTWSAYWYNGYIYSSDMAKGLDILKVRGPEFAGAQRIKMDHFNAQTQPRYRD
ncbi:hypothetical protein CLV30_101411 [Haloactinopolyspora alba]|uniref:LVIVD repeat-containing protein n=1 Tax=Haloactinopolyspora alba TaxID=648780 RepID=A0A2P8EG46_9ACTN|nr:hypothetical protein [Haloactinopolyspora alba]PSL08439.1 hypothetical protein CLV30_101411 [Haloactinopolyspora alba]